jgi:hypothetical protein
MSNINLLSPFHLRFKDKLSMIGKDGVNGLLKQTKMPIEPLNNISRGTRTKTNKSRGKVDNTESLYQSLPFPVVQNTYANNEPSYEKYSTISKYNPSNKIDSLPLNSYKSSTLSRSHDPQAYYRLLYNNNSQVLPQITGQVNDTSMNYTPYTLKDYQTINRKENYEMGKLGPNLYTESWRKKYRKNSKIKDYSSNIKEENINYKREQSSRTRELMKSLKNCDKNIGSTSLQRKSSYGRKVENLRIGVNLSPYIIYNNKRKLNTLKEELNKSIDRNYIQQSNKRPISRIRLAQTDKDSLKRQLLLKGNIRENILNKYKNSLV